MDPLHLGLAAALGWLTYQAALFVSCLVLFSLWWVYVRVRRRRLVERLRGGAAASSWDVVVMSTGPAWVAAFDR